MVRMSKPTQQFKLRLPENLRGDIEKTAKINRRSLTSEIVLRLEDSLQKERYPLSQAPRVVRIGKGGDTLEAREPDKHTARDLEKRLLEAFRAMPPTARQGLIALLEGIRTKDVA